MDKGKKEEVKEARRSFDFFVGGEKKTFYLEMPNSEQIRKAEWHYSKVFNKALVDGVATHAEMMDILSKRGIYSPEYEKRIQELQVEIAIKIAQAQNEEDVEKKEELANRAAVLRDELYRWNQRVTGPLSNTCEQMADDAKTEYLTSVVLRDGTGNLVWKSYDDFVSEENQAFALKSRVEVLLWLQGLDTDFLDKTPEGQILKEVSARKAEQAAFATRELPAAPEEPMVEVSEEAEEKPVKSTRKKRGS